MNLLVSFIRISNQLLVDSNRTRFRGLFEYLGQRSYWPRKRTTRLLGSTLDLFDLRSQTDEDREEEKPRAPFQRAMASRFRTYEAPYTAYDLAVRPWQ